ncbi:hypothetical protein [Flavicella sediminum]|uniref:hypothetical protein n=1 Tax=Flavicella sediminum TaxID=2585141 RepID=UPI001122253E|nr:hypothetical protein [Flavicella sediminum]
MSTLLENLELYFRNTPQEKIDSDWEKTEKYDEVGPNVSDFIIQSKLFEDIEKIKYCSLDILFSQEIIENPKFASDFSF